MTHLRLDVQLSDLIADAPFVGIDVSKAIAALSTGDDPSMSDAIASLLAEFAFIDEQDD